MGGSGFYLTKMGGSGWEWFFNKQKWMGAGFIQQKWLGVGGSGFSFNKNGLEWVRVVF